MATVGFETRDANERPNEGPSVNIVLDNSPNQQPSSAMQTSKIQQKIIYLSIFLLLSLLILALVIIIASKRSTTQSGSIKSETETYKDTIAYLQNRTITMMSTLGPSRLQLRCKSALKGNSPSSPNPADCLFLQGNISLWADKCDNPGNHGHFASQPWLYLCNLSKPCYSTNTTTIDAVSNIGNFDNPGTPRNVYCCYFVNFLSTDLKVNIAQSAMKGDWQLQDSDGKKVVNSGEQKNRVFFSMSLKSKRNLCFTCPQNKANFVYLDSCIGSSAVDGKSNGSSTETDATVSDEQLFYLSGTGVEY